jgi:hypothetical protein
MPLTAFYALQGNLFTCLNLAKEIYNQSGAIMGKLRVLVVNNVYDAINVCKGSKNYRAVA